MTVATDATIEDARRKLDAAATELVKVCSKSDDLTKPLSYLIGALYSLRMAQRLGIPDRAATRASDDATDLAALASELVRGELRTTGRWVEGYWANNAAIRITASFERVCLAIGYARSIATDNAQREEDANRWFEKERDGHLQGSKGSRASELGTVWDAVNTQKHDFCAPKHTTIAAINELVLVRALTTVLLLATANVHEISQAYQGTAGFSSGRRRRR